MNIKKSEKKTPEYYEDMKSNKNSWLIHVSDVFGRGVCYFMKCMIPKWGPPEKLPLPFLWIEMMKKIGCLDFARLQTLAGLATPICHHSSKTNT